MGWLSNIVVELLASRRASVLFLAVAVLFTIYSRYGGGTPLEAVEAPFTPFAKPPELVSDGHLPLRRIAIGQGGEIYGVVHPRFQTRTFKVVKIASNGQAEPFPDEDWQRGIFTRPTSVTVDGRGLVWIAEDDPLGLHPPRVLAIDPAGAGKLLVDKKIDRHVLPRGSTVNDIALTSDGLHLVLADSSPLRLSPRLVHYDIGASTFSAKLVQHSAIHAHRHKAVVGGQGFGAPLGFKVHREGANAVAFSPDGQRMYFAAASNDGLFALPTLDFLRILDAEASAVGQVSHLSRKPWSEDVVIDLAGNVYITDAEGGRVLRRSPDGALTSVVPPGTFLWPSGLAFGPDGKLYVSETALNVPRWRSNVATVVSRVPLGLGATLADWVMGPYEMVHSFGVWRLDMGIGGVPG